jgi:cobalamin-dependent methionine synthase I
MSADLGPSDGKMSGGGGGFAFALGGALTRNLILFGELVQTCAPGERHDIGLIAFGLVLRSHGWRILFLGADTPIATLRRAVETTDPRLVVVACMDSGLLEAQSSELRRLGRAAPLVLAGTGATDDHCARLRGDRLDGDLVAAAGDVSRSV